MPAYNLTLTAKFEIQRYELTYDNDGWLRKEAVVYDTILPSGQDPTKKGYIFTGWYTERIGGVQWNFVKGKMPARDMTLYAQYKEEEQKQEPEHQLCEVGTYAVRFIVEGEVVGQGCSVPDTELTPPSVPTKDDHKFSGWYTQPETKKRYRWIFKTNRTKAEPLTLYGLFSAVL